MVKDHKLVVEYPLKVAEIDEFFLNFDNLIWQRLSRAYASLLNTSSHATPPSSSSFNCFTSGHYYESSGANKVAAKTVASSQHAETNSSDEIVLVDKHVTRPFNKTSGSSHRPCLPVMMSTSSLTLLFIDSELLRRNFEKSHLKLVNNIIVLDR